MGDQPHRADRPGHGTLCFHGAPGSGKSALAAHIAQALGRPLHIRQPSDLMSKYVGETEQSMAAMFHDAEREGAVLLLDEADSFLQDRRGAQRHYEVTEVTEVNEMLQGMERFRGVFICTTNLMDQLDAAVQRRAQILAETLDAEAFVAQLEAEHRIKPEVRERRSTGFTH